MNDTEKAATHTRDDEDGAFQKALRKRHLEAGADLDAAAIRIDQDIKRNKAGKERAGADYRAVQKARAKKYGKGRV